MVSEGQVMIVQEQASLSVRVTSILLASKKKQIMLIQLQPKHTSLRTSPEAGERDCGDHERFKREGEIKVFQTLTFCS